MYIYLALGSPPLPHSIQRHGTGPLRPDCANNAIDTLREVARQRRQRHLGAIEALRVRDVEEVHQESRRHLICMYVCVYVCMCVCVYVYMCICVYVSMCLCVYVSMCICRYASVYMCIYVYLYMYIYIYICIYVYVYIYMYVCMYICIYVCI